ncbi:MAG: HAMP domain-containing protein [Spirochaetes bacterium]|nr:HAMP domain-containing protein [Spirochaetota bacterium]
MLKVNSIQVKILTLIIITLLITIIITMIYTIDNQRENLLKASQENLANNTDMLNRVMRNIMLSGEAPIAVITMRDLKQMQAFSEIAIYRTDGNSAFNDYSTLDLVNTLQNEILFPKTERIDRNMIENQNFIEVLETHTGKQDEDFEKEEMEYFFPILNMPECWKCHGDDHSIRGIAHFKISVADIYLKINNARKNLTLVFIISGILLGTLLIIFIHMMIIHPILKIGSVVKQVGEGRFDVQVKLKSGDELGDLAAKINNMVQGLKERFQLSKYVSKSTDELVKKTDEQQEASSRKHTTVLFSDIRGFTAFSDNSEPHEVIQNLNDILQSQTHIVEKFNGDIDKFVGDEIMAVFDNPQDAVRCGYHLIKAVYEVNKKNNTSLYIGVGINSGEVVAGNIGSKNRLEYAIIGDTVNLASRLCSMAKKNMLLISKNTYEEVKDIVDIKIIANQKIKGKNQLIDVYAVLGLKE